MLEELKPLKKDPFKVLLIYSSPRNWVVSRCFCSEFEKTLNFYCLETSYLRKLESLALAGDKETSMVSGKLMSYDEFDVDCGVFSSFSSLIGTLSMKTVF